MSRKDGTNHEAAAMLTMDQYNQDESLALEYQESGGKRGAGLVVYGDHPDKSLKPLLEANAEMVRAPTEEARQAAKTRYDQLLKDSADLSGKRLFVGREADDALVLLSDKQGRPRIVMQVDGKGEPSIELHDADGKVVKRIDATTK